VFQIPGNPERLPEVIDQVNEPDKWGDFQFDPDGTKLLEIWIADIRDADATLILYDRQAWMIDCGDEKMGERTAAMLKQLGVTHITKIFNSHPHHDHLLGLPATGAAAKVDELLICFPEDSTEHMIKIMQYCAEQDITVSHFEHGDEYWMGDGKVRMTFWQNPDNLELNMNNRSAATMITYGDRSILLLADIEYAGQSALMDLVGADALKADLMKYPHHGKLPMKETFYQAVSPEAAIITNYLGGAYESSRYLGTKRCPQIFTNKKGLYTHLVTDGKHWLCEYVPILEQN
jgi:beta-lactamase superfamily II metal-dependent hydrolase